MSLLHAWPSSHPWRSCVVCSLRRMQCTGCWGGHMARCGQSRGWVAGQGPSANAQAAQRLVGVVRGARGGGGVSVVRFVEKWYDTVDVRRTTGTYDAPS